MCDMTHSYVTWLIHTSDVTYSYVRYDSSICVTFKCVTWLIHVCDITHHMCDMTHSYVWHDWFICVTLLIHMCDMTDSYVWHDSFICMTWLIHICDMTHSYMHHDSFMCVAWLIHMYDMTYSYARHDSFICITWLNHVCDMTHSYMWHDSFICVTWLIHIYDTTHSHTWHDSCIPCMTCLEIWWCDPATYLQHPATHCKALQHGSTLQCIEPRKFSRASHSSALFMTHCNTLQLQRTATHCNAVNPEESLMVHMQVPMTSYPCFSAPWESRYRSKHLIRPKIRRKEICIKIYWVVKFTPASFILYVMQRV